MRANLAQFESRDPVALDCQDNGVGYWKQAKGPRAGIYCKTHSPRFSLCIAQYRTSQAKLDCGFLKSVPYFLFRRRIRLNPRRVSLVIRVWVSLFRLCQQVAKPQW